MGVDRIGAQSSASSRADPLQDDPAEDGMRRCPNDQAGSNRLYRRAGPGREIDAGVPPPVTRAVSAADGRHRVQRWDDADGRGRGGGA